MLLCLNLLGRVFTCVSVAQGPLQLSEKKALRVWANMKLPYDKAYVASHQFWEPLRALLGELGRCSSLQECHRIPTVAPRWPFTPRVRFFSASGSSQVSDVYLLLVRQVPWTCASVHHLFNHLSLHPVVCSRRIVLAEQLGLLQSLPSTWKTRRAQY